MTLPGYAVFHRDMLTLSPLMIDGSGPYKVADQGVIDQLVTWTEDVVSAPWVEGDTVTNRIRGMVQAEIRVQVRDTAQSAVAADIAVLYAAAAQQAFVFDLVIGDETYKWSCRAARSIGLTFNRAMIFSKIVTVPVIFDRYPTPLAGPF